MNRKTFFTASILIGIHILILLVIPRYIFPEIAFSSSMISITKNYVSEDSFLHPWLLYYIVSHLSRLTSVSIAFLSLNVIITTIIDSILFIYLKNRFSGRLAVAGLIFYIPWQVYFRGNSLWFDFLTIPFILISYIYFQNYLKKPTSSKLFKAASILSLGYLFKQTIIWITLLYLLWVIVILIKKRLPFVKNLFLFFIPLVTVIFLNSALLLIKGSLLFTFQWSFVIPLFVFSRLPNYILLIDKYYFKILIFLILLLLFNIFIIVKFSKHSRKEIYLLCSMCIMSLGNIFPRWSDFRVQPFLVFLSISFVFALSNFKDIKILWKKVYIVIIFLVAVFTSFVLVLKTTNEWRRVLPLAAYNGTFISRELEILVRNNSVFMWDSPVYFGDPKKDFYVDTFALIKMIIANPDEYYRTQSSKFSLDQIKSKSTDSIIVPKNIRKRLESKLDLVELEKYILENYNYAGNSDFEAFIYTKK